MFSDRYRYQKIIILSILLLVLCFYCYRQVPRLTEVTVKDNASAAQGQELKKIAFATVIQVLEDGHIILKVLDKRIEVKNVQGELRVGQRVSVTGYPMSDKLFVAESVVVHKYRWLKKLVSLVAMALVFFMMFTRYQVLVKDRIIIEKDKCRTY